MPKGGARQGAGRKPGGKNKATIEREIVAAQAIDASRQGTVRLGKEVLAKMMDVAEGAAALHRPQPPEAGEKVDQAQWNLFGAWFDRTVYCAKELAKYQSPQFRTVEAPAPPPDPNQQQPESRRRFGLRVFEGGKPVTPKPANDAA